MKEEEPEPDFKTYDEFKQWKADKKAKKRQEKDQRKEQLKRYKWEKRQGYSTE